MPQIDVNDDQRTAIGQIASDVLLSSATQSMAAGESAMMREDLSNQAALGAHPYLKDLQDFAPSPPPPSVTTLGPFNTNSITFSNGVPVGGYASLTLHSDGTYNFSGHFHVSGAPSYNVQFTWVIVDAAGRAYSFATSGHLAGTFESGSRDFNWTNTDRNNNISANWADLVNRYTWRWQANVNWNVQAAVDSLVSALKAAGTVISVVISIVS